MRLLHTAGLHMHDDAQQHPGAALCMGDDIAAQSVHVVLWECGCWAVCTSSCANQHMARCGEHGCVLLGDAAATPGGAAATPAGRRVQLDVGACQNTNCP